MTRVLDMPARWTPLYISEAPLRWYRTPIAVGRIERALESWRETRYGSGQRCRGILADCLGFAFGVIDDVDGRPRAQCSSFPPDVSFHDPRLARRSLALLRRLYEPCQRLRDGLLQPMDVVVVGPSGGGPGHVMLVGYRRNTLWHCARESGVCESGWSLPGEYRLIAAYRMSDRQRWLERR